MTVRGKQKAGMRFPSSRIVLFIAGACVSAVLFFRPHAQVLEITKSNGERVLCSRLTRGEEFVLSFIHSVNRRPVYDTLRADDKRIIIVKSRFDSFGAGMPDSSTDEGTLKVMGDGWLEWTVNRPVTDFVVRVGRVANHTLILKGREIPLSRLAEPGSALSFRVRKVSLYCVMKGRCER